METRGGPREAMRILAEGMVPALHYLFNPENRFGTSILLIDAQLREAVRTFERISLNPPFNLSDPIRDAIDALTNEKLIERPKRHPASKKKPDTEPKPPTIGHLIQVYKEKTNLHPEGQIFAKVDGKRHSITLVKAQVLRAYQRGIFSRRTLMEDVFGKPYDEQRPRERTPANVALYQLKHTYGSFLEIPDAVAHLGDTMHRLPRGVHIAISRWTFRELPKEELKVRVYKEPTKKYPEGRIKIDVNGEIRPANLLKAKIIRALDKGPFTRASYLREIFGVDPRDVTMDQRRELSQAQRDLRTGYYPFEFPTMLFNEVRTPYEKHPSMKITFEKGVFDE